MVRDEVLIKNYFLTKQSKTAFKQRIYSVRSLAVLPNLAIQIIRHCSFDIARATSFFLARRARTLPSDENSSVYSSPQ